MTTLPAFPTDEVTLANLEHALGGAYEVDQDGTHRIVGAEFGLSQFLDFMSGYDDRKLIPMEDIGGTPAFEYPDAVYTRDCVIRALIDEVRRLRREGANRAT